jgi:hypothetical protein
MSCSVMSAAAVCHLLGERYNGLIDLIELIKISHDIDHWWLISLCLPRVGLPHGTTYERPDFSGLPELLWTMPCGYI